MSGRYGTGESVHIKAARRQPISHLETTCSRFYTNEEENVLISGTMEMSAVADSAEPKQ
jgi:hypothetical protein